MSSAMFCLLIVLLLFGVWTAIFPSQIAATAYAALGAFVFSLFIVYDTQLIIGGKHHSHRFGIDEYIFAALTLYIVRCGRGFWVVALSCPFSRAALHAPLYTRTHTRTTFCRTLSSSSCSCSACSGTEIEGDCGGEKSLA